MNLKFISFIRKALYFGILWLIEIEEHVAKQTAYKSPGDVNTDLVGHSLGP